MPRMPTARRLLPLALVVACLLAPETAAAQGSSDPELRDQIVFYGDVLVRRGEQVGEVVVMRGRVLVAGVVRGDVVVLNGRIQVTGQVSGSVVMVSGPVALGSSSHVRGDVISGEEVALEEGAKVDGDIRQDVTFALNRPIEELGRFAPWVAVWASALALGLVLLLIAPGGADAVAGAARSAPWASLGWGVAASLLLPVLGALAVVSLVWLPLGLGLLGALFLLYSVGIAWSAFALGRLLWREPRGRVLAFAFGWAILTALAAIPRVGGVMWVAAAVVGLGAMTVAAWRARRREPRTGGRHRASGKMPEPSVVPMVTEAAMGKEGTGL
jgi:cytoskeletal protein CcmA (bactofilin family)